MSVGSLVVVGQLSPELLKELRVMGSYPLDPGVPNADAKAR